MEGEIILTGKSRKFWQKLSTYHVHEGKLQRRRHSALLQGISIQTIIHSLVFTKFTSWQ